MKKTYEVKIVEHTVKSVVLQIEAQNESAAIQEADALLQSGCVDFSKGNFEQWFEKEIV